MEYIVSTPCGKVRGCQGHAEGTVAYKGIRYATAGRWEYPKQVTSWDGVYDATEYGSCSYQPRAFYDEETNQKKYFYYKEFRKGASYTYSEDCLFLNVFAPENAKADDKLPVLIYIHGGSFTGGCGHEKHFDGPVWPAKGIIGVTINYRLGPLGFLTLPELKQEAGITGNYGLYDQMTAFQWVKDNIASFGGDPENVTIMGQSAGAMSVQQHCLSPLTKGMFRRAIMSSGGGVSKMMSARGPESNYDFWRAVMAKAGCANLEEFRKLDPELLFTAWETCKKEVKGGAMAVSPCIDGKLIVGTGSDLLAAGKQHDISYMAGSNSQDMMPPVLYSMAKGWCASQKENSYVWYFDRQLPGDEHGAWHSSDLWYWFGTLDNCWRPMEMKDYNLSDKMISYLVNFCKFGDPNGAGLPAWLPVSGKQSKPIRFGEGNIRMEQPGLLKMVKTMFTNKAVGE